MPASAVCKLFCTHCAVSLFKIARFGFFGGRRKEHYVSFSFLFFFSFCLFLLTFLFQMKFGGQN